MVVVVVGVGTFVVVVPAVTTALAPFRLQSQVVVVVVVEEELLVVVVVVGATVVLVVVVVSSLYVSATKLILQLP